MKKFIASAVTVVAAFMLSSCVKPISVSNYEPVIDLELLKDKKERLVENYENDLRQCRELTQHATEAYKKRYREEVKHDIQVAAFRALLVGGIGVAAVGTEGIAAGLLGIPNFINSTILSRTDHVPTLEAYHIARNGGVQIVDKCMQNRGYPLLFDLVGPDGKGKAEVRGF